MPKPLPNVRRVVLAAALLLTAALPSLFAQAPSTKRIRKPSMDDTIRANVYADNTFELYVNGTLVAVDSIPFIPHNVISVDLLPAYPMTIAVLAKDNFDPQTGMEYANTNIGDAGFILKFSDGTVTDARWKAKCFSRGPVGGDATNPRVDEAPLPDGWSGVDFDDSSWEQATEYTEEDVGPKQPFYDADFAGATFIWSGNLKLDNVVAFRTVVATPPDGKAREDFTGLNDVVPESPPRGRGDGKGRQQGKGKQR